MSLPCLTDQFGRFLRESPIKVFVGSDRAVYYVHPGVLSACKSSTTDTRMNGSWKDAGDSAIDWTDFDSQTIECVLHYLYTGDYHVVNLAEEALISTIEDEEIHLEQSEEKQLDPNETSQSPQTDLPDGDSLMRPLTPIRACLDAGLPAEGIQTAAGAVAKKDFKDHEHNVGPSVLVHAKVYSFAHRHFFLELGKLALQRLTQILILVPCKQTCLFPYLADAIRHIYGTTPGPELQEDPARKLLSQYVAINYTDLTGEELDKLAVEGAEFMVDLLSKLARQINDLTTKTREFQMILKDKEEELQRARQEIQECERDRKSVV